MFSYSKFDHIYEKSYFNYKLPLSEDYRVFVNGKEVPVYTCRISKYPFNTVWPGYQRPVNQTEVVSYVNLVSDEELEIEILTDLKYDRPLLKPYSRGIKLSEENGRIKFTMKENDKLVFEPGSYHHCLYIFNSKPVEKPKREAVTYYFEPGIHFAGKLALKNNESVYVDKDAYVYGCIYAENVDNIHIFGNGIFDDSHEERTGNYCYENFTNGNLKFYECSNIRIEGVGFQNSAEWCVNIFNCRNVYIEDIKIFGQWRYNTDGIDPVNSQNIYINNSFIHSFDDTISIKGIDRYCHTNNENIHITNCTLWSDWGKCCTLGIETLCKEYKNISFKNCDILRGGGRVLSIDNGECAEISNVVFENINVEYNNFDTVEQYQNTYDEEYVKQNEILVPLLIQVVNPVWNTPQNRILWDLPPEPEELDMTGLKPKSVHDVVFKNINVYYDEGLPELPEKFDRIHIESLDENAEFYNIDISGIKINGKEVSI